MSLDMSTFIPATPFGILELIERYGVETQGKHTVVIGRSHIVGRPISILMGRKGFPGNSTVTLTHSRTKNITQITSQADIIISALGVPGFLKAEMVKDDVVIIDHTQMMIHNVPSQLIGIVTHTVGEAIGF